MRCPKCGYISFDNLANCAKCSFDLEELATRLSGSGIQAEPPALLASLLTEAEPATTPVDEATAEEVEEEITFDLAEEEPPPAGGEPTLETGEPPAAEEVAVAEEEAGSAAVETTAEPVIEADAGPAPETLAADETADADLDLDLGLDETATSALEEEPPATGDAGDVPLDLELDIPEAEVAAAAEPETAVADELDLDLELEEETPAAAAAGGSPPATDELDLELGDLTGAEEHGAPESGEETAAQGALADLDLELEEDTAPELVVGEPAPLRDTSDPTGSLEEIDLADLVADEEELAEDTVDATTLEEALFDLSDVLEEVEEDEAKAKG